VAYAASQEMAVKPNDVLCRRIPISFLDLEVAKSLLPEVVEILGAELEWSEEKKKQELADSLENIQYML
jgi:glycerol-3-phosphate dehydrogenase